MHSRTLASLVLLAGPLMAGGCDEPTPPADGSVRIIMETPLPNELTSRDVQTPPEDIRIMIGEVHVHRIDGTWIEVFPEDDGARVDFGDLPPALATAELPAGEYDQLRLVAYEAEVTIDGQVAPLKLIDDHGFGFDAFGTFCVPETDRSATLELPVEGTRDEPEAPLRVLEDLHLRWDAGRGVQFSEARGYWLDPTVYVEDGPACP